MTATHRWILRQWRRVMPEYIPIVTDAEAYGFRAGWFAHKSHHLGGPGLEEAMGEFIQTRHRSQ